MVSIIRFLMAISVFTALFAFAAGACYGDVAVTDLVNDMGVEFSWEPYRQVGTIKDGISRITFIAGGDRALINRTQEDAIGTIYLENGVLMASEQAEASLRSLFPSKEEGLGPRISAIVLDPGHGGRDPGTNHSHIIDGQTYHLVEKEIVLHVSIILQSLLQRRFPGIEIFLTRTDDRYLELEERVEIANSLELDEMQEAIIFVSIHANASLNPQSYGYEVWYLPPEYGRENLIKEESVEEDSKSPSSRKREEDSCER